MTPESYGISSREIERFLSRLERKRIPMHSLLIARGDTIVYSAYWAPFTRDRLHRMNSITKSFVSLAIGVLYDDGKLKLTDRVLDYFPEMEDAATDPSVRDLTLHNLLCMKTAYTEHGGHWIRDRQFDRISSFFTSTATKPRDTLYLYDSAGSYILGVVVERLTGKPFLDFLKERVLNEIGFSPNATCIKDYAGYSWGDSGLLCTTEDLFLTARLIAKGGEWNGKQLISRDYLQKATARQASSAVSGWNTYASNGYGYQIWREREGGFGFHGMGNQLMVCIPKRDLTVVCTADTQGFEEARTVYWHALHEFIDSVDAKTLPQDPEVWKRLEKQTKRLSLSAFDLGCTDSPARKQISGVCYTLKNNPMGIRRIRVDLDANGGTLTYENAQGEKVIPFGMCKNVFANFPEDGYSDLHLGESPKNFRHPAAASAAWMEERTLGIRIQIIGNQLASVFISMGFSGDNLGLRMQRTTNCFLDTYNGYATGHAKR